MIRWRTIRLRGEASGPKSDPAGQKHLDPMDLFDVRSALTEEERMVQDSVARLVDEKVLPIIQKCFEEHRFPRELVPELAALGLLGSSIEGYGCAGLNGISYGLICQQLERGDSGIRSFVSVQSSLCMYPIYAFGSEEQKQQYLPAHGPRRAHRLLRSHRAARGLGSGEHEDPCQALGQGLGPQRREDVDHQRGDRRSGGRVGDDRGRHPRLHRRQRHARVCRHGDRAQVLPARLRHRRAVLRQRPGARGERAAGGRGAERPAVLPDPGALWHRLGGDRGGPGLFVADARVHARAGAVRPHAGPQPGHPDSPGRDGPADHHRAVARAAVGTAEGLRAR